MNLLLQFADFLETQKDKPSFLTVKNYKADVGQFITWLENEFKSPFNPSNLNSQILEQYKKSRNLSSVSIERHISSLRKFSSFLNEKGLIDFNLFAVKPVSERIAADPWMLKNFKSHLYEYKKSNLTIKNYISDIKSFFEWLSAVSKAKDAWQISERNLLNKINFSVINEYRERLVSSNFQPRTINRKLSSLRSYIRWGISQEFIKNFEDTVQEIIPEQDSSFPPAIAWRRSNWRAGPPVRLAQKSLKGANFLFDNIFIYPLAKTIQGAQYLLWRLSGKKIFKKNVILSNAKNLRSFGFQPQDDIVRITNIKKEFYAPLDVSLRYFPTHKKVWHYIHHVRPEWYKRYHSYSIAHYLHFAILFILTSAIGFGIFNGFYADTQKNKSTLGAVFSLPPRILSFQGKLTDSANTPITAQTNILFSLYDDDLASAAASLWQETDSVKPDSDGVFSVLLGKSTPIPDTVFSQNSKLFLGITVGSGPELRPRQQIATVPFASNAETLQGLEPITNSTKVSNVVLALDSSGNLSIAGSKAHTFQAIGGNLIISGRVLSLTTIAGSNSRVEIAPDGMGKIDLSKPIQNSSNNNNISAAAGSVEFDDTVAILATTSAQAALYINQNSTGALISASTSGTAKFVVENDGTGKFSGDVAINGGNLTSTAKTFNLLNSTVTTLSIGGAATTLNLGLKDGTINLKSNVNAAKDFTLSALTSNGGILYTNSSGKILQASAGSSSDCLMGGTTPSFAPCSNINIFNQAGGAIYAGNTTMDVLFGGTATSSAKFGFINLAAGSPTATISSNLSLVVPTGNAPASTFNLLNNGSLNIQRSPGGDGGLTTALFVQNSGNIGIGTTAPVALFEVKGSGTGAIIAKFTDNNTTGCTLATGGTISCSSDIRLKKNFENIAYGLDAVMALKPVAFNWKFENDDTTKNLGFIAQEVEQIIPKLVTTDSDGYKQLNAIGLVPVLTKALQEQQTQITSLSAIVKDISLTSTGELEIVSSSKYQVSSIGNKVSENSPILNAYYLIHNTSKELIDRVGAFTELAVANLRVGLVKTSEIITSSLIITTDAIIINGQNLRDYIATVISDSGIIKTNSEIISPVVKTDHLSTNVISPLSSDSLVIKLSSPSGSLIVQNASGSAVATIDSTGKIDAGSISVNQASISGNLNASDASISGTLRASNIIADSIDGLEARVKYLIHNTNYADIASFSAQLAYVPNLQAEQGLFNQGLMVFGPTSLSDLSVAGQLSIGGSMFVTENSIEVLGTDLSLQSLRQGGLSIMGGLVYIDTQGNIKVKGDLSITGKLAVNIISPLPSSDLVINNASGSAVLSVNQKGDVVASGSGTFAKLNFNFVEPALAISATEFIASSSAGRAFISSYQDEVTIKNALVTDKSVIYITPVGTPSAQSPFLMRQLVNEFTVGVKDPTSKPILFNWLIVN